MEKMKEEFDSNPADLYAAIGPCISMKNFECGEDVISAISHIRIIQNEASSMSHYR